MEKIAIIVLTDTTSSDGLGRIVNALTAAKEYKESGDQVRVVFSGAGTKWIAPLSDQKHVAHPLFSAVRDTVEGACGYCVTAFQQDEAVRDAGVKLLEDYGPNMSYRKLTNEGFRVLTF